MGTTRVKVLDLSSDTAEVKTSRKHAAKIKPQIDSRGRSPWSSDSRKLEIDSRKLETETQGDTHPQTTSEVAQETVEPKKEKRSSPKTGKPNSAKHSGKKYKTAAEIIEKDKLYSREEAFKLLEETSYTKFDPTVEIHLNVSEKNLRGQVNFPHPIGPKKEKRFLVFATKINSDNKNVINGSDETIKDIEEGRLKPVRDFDVVIASASFMPKLVSVAKILGPAGMMPNPKNGTITNNPKDLVDAKVSDAYEFRSDPTAPIIHVKLGKLSLKESKIKDNLTALITAVGSAKIKKATIKTTMSPGIRIDVAQIQ